MSGRDHSCEMCGRGGMNERGLGIATTPDLEALKKLRDAATPGPWAQDGDGDVFCVPMSDARMTRTMKGGSCGPMKEGE